MTGNINKAKKEKVFIGGNYDNMALLRKIQDYIDTKHFDPQIVLIKHPKLPPWEIHKRCIETLKACDYAIFEETFPAGELMELESVATTKKISTLILYQIRGSESFGYPSQLSSMVTSLAQEREFEKITLAGYSSIDTLPLLIHGFLGRPFESENCLLLFSIGTLDKVRRDYRMKQLREFEGNKVIFTGWNFERAKKEADDCNASAIICEASIFYLRKRDPVGGHWTAGTPFYTEKDLERAKHLNKLMLDEICFLDREPILFSQGDEVSIDYYVNPPEKSYDKFPQWQTKAPSKDAPMFRKHLVEDYGINEKDISIIGENGTCLKLADSVNNRYFVEKVNARYRTFTSYSLRFEQIEGEAYIIVDLDHVQLDKKLRKKWSSKQDWSCEILEKVITRAKNNPLGSLSDEDWGYITPNPDSSIDILAQTKDKSWKQGLKELEKQNLYRKKMPVFYISNATESDRPFVVKAYSDPSVKFCAFGLSEMFREDLRRSTPLIAAGVIVKDELEQILDVIRPTGKKGRARS